MSEKGIIYIEPDTLNQYLKSTDLLNFYTVYIRKATCTDITFRRLHIDRKILHSQILLHVGVFIFYISLKYLNNSLVS